VKWSENYATGVARIDAQHQMLFRMSEDFRLALDEGGGEGVFHLFLEGLELYALAHFRFEEGCMERCHCPAAEANKSAHVAFEETIRRFRERSRRGFDGAEARELTAVIDSWLANHIARIDVQLREWAEPELPE
jgi:hemerythrin